MQRIDSATAVADLNGTGKNGFTEGSFPGTPATQLTAKWFNQQQEEIANVIEVTKATALSTSTTQLRDALLTRTRGPVLRGMKNFVNLNVDVVLKAVIWTEELQAFVGVGNGKAFRSPDGVVWHQATGMVAGDYQALAFDPSSEVFVAIGASGAIRRSVDEGSVWSGAAFDPNPDNWTSVCWAASLGLFVAVGTSGTFRVTTSATGSTWANRSQSENNAWQSVCWSPSLSLLVAVSSNGTNRVMTSPDGINWTSRSTPATLNAWKSVCWSPTLNLFVAVSDGVDGTNGVMTSPNGIAWTFRDIPAPLNPYKQVIWVPDLLAFVAIADLAVDTSENGANAALMYSFDGLTWLNAPTPIYSYGTAIAWSPSLHAFCAIAANDIDTAVNFMIS